MAAGPIQRIRPSDRIGPGVASLNTSDSIKESLMSTRPMRPLSVMVVIGAYRPKETRAPMGSYPPSPGTRQALKDAAMLRRSVT